MREINLNNREFSEENSIFQLTIKNHHHWWQVIIIIFFGDDGEDARSHSYYCNTSFFIHGVPLTVFDQ